MPPIFFSSVFFEESWDGNSPHISMGHLSLTLSDHFLDGSMARQPSTTAIEKRYWMKTMKRSGDAAANGKYETQPTAISTLDTYLRQCL